MHPIDSVWFTNHRKKASSHMAALKIQQNVRSLLAKKSTNRLRMNQLLHLTRDIQKEDDTAHFSVSIAPLTTTLFKRLDQVLWETRRFVRDVSVNWWRVSQYDTIEKLRNELYVQQCTITELMETLSFLNEETLKLLQEAGHPRELQSLHEVYIKIICMSAGVFTTYNH